MAVLESDVSIHDVGTPDPNRPHALERLAVEEMFIEQIDGERQRHCEDQAEPTVRPP